MRLPRPLHPGAWWAWALALAAAASRTTNPVLLLLIVAVIAHVVVARRSDAPWARGFGAYVVLGLVVIAVRVVFRALLDAGEGGTVLFTVPEVSLPEAAAGIDLGGPIALEGLVAAAADGLRLATMLLCIGAANLLADPKRLLKAVPAALHEIGVAVTVALSVAPQLVESGLRVRRARRLRGGERRRFHLVREVALPVMTDALDRSLLLAAAMDVRGHGRTAAVPPAVRRATGALLLVGLGAITVGTYGLLDATTPAGLGVPLLAAGMAVGAAGIALGGRRVARTRYRPDPWAAPEWVVTASGVTVAAVLIAAGAVDPAPLHLSLQPLRWPELPVVPAAAIVLAALPAWVSPPVQLPVGPAVARRTVEQPA